MKLNTVLLTSAATLMATSVAYAADLPSKKAAPSAGSVQVCKVAGTTGFTLPGSDTCVAISGYVFAEVVASGSGTGKLDTSSNYNNYSTFLREQINVDALSNTEMGVLKSHASFRFNQNGSSVNGGGNYYDTGSYTDGVGAAGIDSAYIQLGGLKVGYYGSTFGMMDGSPSYEAPNNSPSNTYMQIGYSASLGSGVTLGVALEDVRSYGAYSEASTSSDLTSGDYPGRNNVRMPDVVGTLDFATGMADIHLGAVYHDIYNSDDNPGSYYYANDSYDTSGYAFDAGVKLKLDSIAKGDTLGLEYTYVNGAGARIAGHNAKAGVIGDRLGAVWSDITSSGGDYIKVTGSNYAASFHHVFSNKLSMELFGAYGDVESYDYKMSSTLVGANLDFQPVKNFHIQPEIWYQHVTNDYNDVNNYEPSSPSAIEPTGSKTTAMLRIRRDF